MTALLQDKVTVCPYGFKETSQSLHEDSLGGIANHSSVGANNNGSNCGDRWRLFIQDLMDANNPFVLAWKMVYLLPLK